jgi:acyl-CoA synthetase (AMP-forming)/AMP-acid ligase II
MAALLKRLNRNSNMPVWTKNNLKHVFVGTAALPQKIQQDFETTFGVPCLESYGMSEILFVSSQSTMYSIKRCSVGRLLNNISIHTRDQQGNILPAGTEGEIWVNSPYTLSGYLNPDDGNIESPLIDGWMQTGDFGYIDQEGYLFITGRIKDLIIHGGTNVSPKAVEDVLLHHHSILDAAVVGKEHPFWGEEVTAFLILKPGVRFDAHTISAFCKLYLSPDAVPTNYKIVDEFPRSSNGKILKNRLKEYT